MEKLESLVKVFFKYLKNSKGQGLVEIGTVIFFCAVIGLAARESGLIKALTDTYSDKVVIALGPSGISMSETNPTNNNPTDNNPTDNNPTDNNPTDNNPTNNNPTNNNPTNNNPTNNNPTDNNPTNNNPTDNNPTDNNPTNNNPTDNPAQGGGSIGGGNQNQNTGLPIFSDSNIFSYVAGLYEKHKNDGPDWQIKQNVKNEIMNDGNFYNLPSHVIDALYGKTNVSNIEEWVWKEIKASNNWKMDVEDTSISNFLLTYMNNNHLNINNYNDCNTAAMNLISSNSYFNGLEDWRVREMIQNANNTVLYENVYIGYLRIKKKFWSSNTTVSF